jgi:hypothetical protein
MAETPKCGRCGAELPGGALEGLCPQCLGQVVFGISSDEASQQVQGPKSEVTGHVRSGTVEVRPEGDMVVEAAGLRIGRYKLLEKIGEGGFGPGLYGRANRACAPQGGPQGH